LPFSWCSSMAWGKPGGRSHREQAAGHACTGHVTDRPQATQPFLGSRVTQTALCPQKMRGRAGRAEPAFWSGGCSHIGA
jgi:hypothetical protein